MYMGRVFSLSLASLSLASLPLSLPVSHFLSQPPEGANKAALVVAAAVSSSNYSA